MILRYRVSLPGIKGFARVYELRSTMSLYDFHRVLGSELEFPVDQPIQFKALDAAGGLVARYALFDIGYGTVDDVTLGDTVEKGVTSFQYFYDVVDRKSVIITCEGEVDEVPGRRYPALVETKGPNPVDFENGYVAYEDLPEDQKHPQHQQPIWGKGDDDDDDFDDEEEADEEDEDDEGEEEIFDESEI
ncbi:MAG: hypothetical protein II720_01655 [Bacteroidales bacterium]|jgi:hypothetical protein|nr:hypothetical protein [Bacteroidales bacterium]